MKRVIGIQAWIRLIEGLKCKSYTPITLTPFLSPLTCMSSCNSVLLSAGAACGCGCGVGRGAATIGQFPQFRRPWIRPDGNSETQCISVNSQVRDSSLSTFLSFFSRGLVQGSLQCSLSQPDQPEFGGLAAYGSRHSGKHGKPSTIS